MNRRVSAQFLVFLAASLAACGQSRDDVRSVTIRARPDVRASSPVLAPPPVAPAEDAVAEPTTAYGWLIEQLSEPGGYFPSDNLVSNETSYLHVLDVLEEHGVRGGAYIGVGPDQNFSYLAEIRPEVAFIIDIRRDNLLHHLLFKALFENARNRIEFLCLMLGKPAPADLTAWDNASIDEIVVYVDTAFATNEEFERAHARIIESVNGYGVRLSRSDLGTISGIHSTFFMYGLDIRYSNRVRGGFGRFPTWRRLMVESDLNGRRRSYMASEDRFQWLKEFERRDRLIPVVGDLAGPHALKEIGMEIDRRGLVVSAFYVSNVEQYLIQGPEFGRFAATVATLPIAANSMLIRSYFARRWQIPQTIPGHISTQLLERIETFVADYSGGQYPDYVDLVTRNAIPLGDPAPPYEETVTRGLPVTR